MVLKRMASIAAGMALGALLVVPAAFAGRGDGPGRGPGRDGAPQQGWCRQRNRDCNADCPGPRDGSCRTQGRRGRGPADCPGPQNCPGPQAAPEQAK